MTLCTDPDRDGLFVRGAEFADCAALAAVQVGCFADEPWSPATFATLLDCPGTFGLVASTDAAGEAGRVAAFILCRTVADEGEVLSFGVAAVQRRQGWGSRLLCEAVMLLHLAGAATVFLEVAEDNLPALALYGDSVLFRWAGARNTTGGSMARPMRWYYRLLCGQCLTDPCVRSGYISR